jgi:pyruvate dehydrogenase E2 component (dihydrolipoamide acetyltransferase)
MATTVRMPEVLANVTEAAIQAWSVGVGDTVVVGQPFAEIETDKAVVEYTAEIAGTVLQLLVAEGESVDVGTPIAVVGEAGESVTEGSDAPSTASTPSAAESNDSEPASVAHQEPTGRRFVSPLVRKLAREHGLDLASVRGSGPNGRVVRRDIQAQLDAAAAREPAAAAGPAGSTTAAAAPGAAAASAPSAELVPHSRMRKTIARRLIEAKTQVPHFYLSADCRVDRLLELRRELNAAGTVKISVNDLVVKAAAGAFVDVPEANRTWTDDGMLQHRAVDIAIAVSLDDGLVTPVVRGVEGLSVSALGRQIADLAERARSGGLRQHEIEGGSFAVSNLGMYGTQEFTAIINPPQAGILAVGAARQAPVVVDGALEVGTLMTVTLSADHRALDGALAARWLAAFVARIEHPLTILA